MSVSQLFLGRDIAGRRPLTDEEWSAFVSTVIAREFPDGFTVMDGEGTWRDPATQKIVHEQTKILVVASASTYDLADRIDRISQAYRSAYAQTSVGSLTYNACGNFGDEEPAPREDHARPVMTDQ